MLTGLDEILSENMELSRKYERKEEEERQKKQNAEVWAKWEDRQRLDKAMR